jgi:hypothetical protein
MVEKSSVVLKRKKRERERERNERELNYKKQNCIWLVNALTGGSM